MAEENDDDLELGDLRSVFSSMREADDDPPETGMAALMAAARVKADEMKPQPSWWQRFFSAVSRPPVLAFAAVVVLVGGGAIMFRHRSEMKETVRAPAPAIDKARVEESSQEPTQAPAEIVVPAEDPPPTRIDTIRPGTTFQGEAGGKKDGKTEKAATAKVPPAPKKVARPSSTGPSGASAGEDERDVGGIDDSVNVTKETQSLAPDMSPAPVAPTAKRPTASGMSAPLENEVSVADLVKQCETAAAAGNCTFVRQIAKKISAQDAAVYRSKVLGNQKIAACLGN